MRIFWFNGMGDMPEYDEIEDNPKIVDKDYVNVNGKLLHRAHVFKATEETITAYEEYRKALAAWKLQEPNMYQVLNKMERVK